MSEMMGLGLGNCNENVIGDMSKDSFITNMLKGFGALLDVLSEKGSTGYSSPIRITEEGYKTEFSKELDKEILRIVHSFHIDVNHEELTKALEYDRNQFDEGFKKGYSEGYKVAMILRIDKNYVNCGECKHRMFSDMYCECSKGYKGIVQPWDGCEHGEKIEE